MKELKLNLQGEQKIEENARILMERINELKIGKVEFGKNEETEYEGVSRTTGGIDWTTLIIGLSGSGGLVALVRLLDSWLKRNERFEMQLKLVDKEISVKGGTVEERKEILAKFFEINKEN